MWELLPSEGRRCCREKCSVHMSILPEAGEQQGQDRKNQPSRCLWAPIFCPGRCCHREEFCVRVSILQKAPEQ